jgi:hypothetical protein
VKTKGKIKEKSPVESAAPRGAADADAQLPFSRIETNPWTISTPRIPTGICEAYSAFEGEPYALISIEAIVGSDIPASAKGMARCRSSRATSLRRASRSRLSVQGEHGFNNYNLRAENLAAWNMWCRRKAELAEESLNLRDWHPLGGFRCLVVIFDVLVTRGCEIFVREGDQRKAQLSSGTAF